MYFLHCYWGLLVIAGLHLVEQHFVGTTVGKTILRVGLNAVIILTGCVLGLVLKTDYDFKGILAITVLYLFRNRKKAQMWAGVIIFLLMDSLEMFAALSFILIWFYNGTRGRQNKYFFYFSILHICCSCGWYVWQWELREFLQSDEPQDAL